MKTPTIYYNQGAKYYSKNGGRIMEEKFPFTGRDIINMILPTEEEE